MKKIVEKVTKALKSKRMPSSPLPLESFLNTGSTLINLACSGKRSGGFFKGGYVLLVGDSASGKTFLSLTCLAEAAINKNFDDYRFIFDNAEGGAWMDMEKFFGPRMAKRLEPPAEEEGMPVYSTTVEEFYYHVHDAEEDGRPFIYVLDSMDSLDSDTDSSKFEEMKSAHRKGKETTGSFGTARPKINSSWIRKRISNLRKSGSILIIISQTRDNIGFGSQFAPKTRAGGRALKFYADLEIWSSVGKTIKVQSKGKSIQIGIRCKIAVKKNRLTGRERTVDVPLHWSTGMDDVGSCIDYLINEKHWEGKEEGKTVSAPEFDFKGNKEKLIRMIEKEGRETELRKLVASVWKDVDDSVAIKRKSRYE